MKRKDPRSRRRPGQKGNVPNKALEPRLAVGEALFEDFWAQRADEFDIDIDQEIAEQQSILQPRTCIKAHIPACPETKLAERFISCLERRHLQAGWCLLVPSYIGHSREIDLAAQAVIAAIESGNNRNSIMGRTAYHRYGLALTALRQTIDFSDSSLMAVALLSLYEGTMRMHTPAQFSHQYGIAKIMLSRKKNTNGPNELERMLLYSDWDRRFRAPVALGIVSPFDHPYWLNAVPRSRHTPEPIVKMRMLTNRLYIRMPRLILYVRQLRSGAEGVPYVRDEVRTLADELLQLRDAEAESFLLHGVKVVKTEDQWDIPIIRYSFQYQTLQQMVFATAYWHARLILMQICLQLLALPTDPAITLSQNEEEIKSETKRMLTNVFMSFQYAKSLSMAGHLCISQPLVVSFGACSYMDRWQDLPISSIKTWIVLRFNESWGKWGRSFNSRDMEEINGVFSGGPLQGVLPRIYEDEKLLLEMPNAFEEG